MGKFIVLISLALVSVVLCIYLLYQQVTTNGEYIWLSVSLLIFSSMSVVCLPLCKVFLLANKQEVAEFLEQAFEIQEYPQQPRHPQLQQVQPVQQPLLVPTNGPKYGWHDDAVVENGKANDEKTTDTETH